MREFGKRISFVLPLLLGILFWTSSVHAASSVNVGLERDLYADMQFWAAEGLITSQLSSIKPFAAREVGNQLVAAIDRCKMMKSQSAACRRIMESYSRLFRADIEEARSEAKVVGTYFKPVEYASASYAYLTHPYSIYNNEGIDYGEGSNFVVQLQSHARVGKYASFFVQPAFLFNQHFGESEDSRQTFRLHKGYAKLTVSNIELLVGRDSLWWGPGYHGSLLMSNNAHPFDMIKLSNPEPVLLPWILSYLGPVQFNLIFSQLNDQRTDRELANPFLYGLRLGIKPHPVLELGASHLVMFGGPERRNLSLRELNQIFFGNADRQGEKTESNQQVSADMALTFSSLKKYIFVADGFRLYGEIGAEDNGYPPTSRAWLAGLAVFKPFGLDGAVFRSEYASTILGPYNSPDSWYKHSAYPMRYEGRVFGHHAGPESDDFFMEWTHHFEKYFYKLGFDLEISGTKTQSYPQSKKQYFGEVGRQISNQSQISLRYTYEGITNASYQDSERLNNHYLSVGASLYF